MNQILISENKSKKNKTSTVNKKKIVIIFAILVIIFALIIAFSKIYELIKRKEANSQIGILNKPSIEIQPVEDECKIQIMYEGGMDKFIYSWNDGETKERNLNGSTSLKTTIDIPRGNSNTLYVKVIGMDNSENEITKVFTKDEKEENLPEITWQQINGTNNMIITVNSKLGIDNLKYQWEDDEPVVIEGEGKEEIEITIDIKRGTNKINIIATDIEGNTQTKEENIVGILYPEIEVYAQDAILYIKVTHDKGFKKIVFKVNDQELVYDENNYQYNENLKEIKTQVPLSPGKTFVEVTAYSLEHEESVKTYRGEIEIL